MRAAEKEVEAMEKQLIEDAEREGRTLPEGEIKLPMFNELQAKKRADAEKKYADERTTLEQNLSDIENQILEVQKALNRLDGVQPIKSFFQKPTDTVKSEEKTKKRRNSEIDDKEEEKEGGAIGPDGKFAPFPEYDGTEEPHENKKAFTLFCKATRKEVKNSLSASERKNKVSAIHVSYLFSSLRIVNQIIFDFQLAISVFGCRITSIAYSKIDGTISLTKNGIHGGTGRSGMPNDMNTK
jgi:copper chaperone CopZ